MELFRRSPLSEWLCKKFVLARRIIGCGYCAYSITYFIFFLFFKINMTPFIYLPIITPLISAIMSGFIVWVFEHGWNSMFSEIVVK